MSELGGMSNLETAEWIVHDVPDARVPGVGAWTRCRLSG